MQRTMGAGEFKNHCLECMDEVKATGQTIIVTKRGRPVVRIEPAANQDQPLKKLAGAILYEASDIFFYFYSIFRDFQIQE